jgi:hypothetical protein
MRHIKGQDYVGEKLRMAKSQPNITAWFALISLILTYIGGIGFVFILLTQIDTQSRNISATIPFFVKFFFGMAFFGAIVHSISVSFMGLNPRAMNLQKILLTIQGNDIKRLEAGWEGEQAVVSSLSAFDNSWTLFSGVVTNGIMGDVDHVVISNRGVFAIEVKNWSGQISYNDDSNVWHRTNSRNPTGEILKDPAEQIDQNSRALERILDQKVTPIVVFTHPGVSYDGNHPTVTVLALKHLSRWLQNQKAIIDESKVNQLCVVLKSAMM